jgi:hypothetical protein
MRHCVLLLLLLQVTFITLCVLKIVVLGALCYRAYLPFHNVVVNNKFVVAARKLATPSTTFRSRIYSVGSPRVKPAPLPTDCSDSSLGRRQAARSGRKWTSERSETTGSGASDTGSTGVAVVAASAASAKQPNTATATARGSAGAAGTAATVHTAADAGADAKLTGDAASEHHNVIIVARRSTLKNRVLDFNDTI